MIVTDASLARLEATAERYAQRTDARAEKKRILDRRGILYADEPKRVQARLARLNADWTIAQAVDRTAAVATTGRSLGDTLAPESFDADVLGLERLMGRNDMIDVGFLERGYLAARSVGRITVRAAGTAYGTGSLVSPRLLLTNNHVLRSAAEAASSYVEFNYQAGVDGLPLQPVTFRLEPSTFFVTDKALDFSLVAVAARGSAGEQLADFGHLSMIAAEGKVIIGELVDIIQHPNGEPKQLALRENKLVDVLDLYLHYEADTAPGSSGAPVFNDQWELVALHHQGVPKTDAKGKWLTVDDKLWKPEMGEDRLAWKANEGIRVSRLLARLREQQLGGAADELRMQLLESAVVPNGGQRATAAQLGGSPAPPANGRGPLAPERGRATPPRPGELASWTLPLRVSVSLDDAAAAVDGRLGAAADALGGGTPAGLGVPGGLDVAAGFAAVGSTVPPGPAAPAADPAAVAAIESERKGALVALEASRDRPYYEQKADAAAQKTYYARLPSPRKPAELMAALGELLEDTHERRPRYSPLRMVYPWVDLRPKRELRSIYSDIPFAPEDLINEDARIAIAREALTAPGQELALLEATLPYNCEHVVPQSSFAHDEPMRGDLHHLFTCESRCNSFRGNTPYFDFTEAHEAVQQDCGRREGDRFEPKAGKGAAARATFYFLLRYPSVIGDADSELQAERLPVLVAWHKENPVGEWERHRNMAIAEVQGNRNPFIDHPEWVEKLPLETAFG